jgi:hypothetical protein
MIRWKEKWLNWRKKMGEVKEEVKGKGLASKSQLKGDNLVESIKALRDEISRLTVIKDDDTAKEGKEKAAENTRKAGTLRAAHSLLTAAQTLLEDY